MSSVNAPFGLRPSFHPSGTIRPTAGTITSTYGSNIYMGSPVGFIADGSIALAPAAGTGITGAVGVFQGCEYTGVDGRRHVSNIWPASTVATEIVAYFTMDPTIVYDVQADGPLAQSAIGNQYDWSTNGSVNGNTITGFSSVTLAAASGGANNGMRVIGITKGPDNDWGDLFTVVQVQLSEHQFVATIAAI